MKALINNMQSVVDTVSSTMGNSQVGQTSGSDIYVVMTITLIVWGGLFFYLIYLDRQIKKVKSKIDIKEN